LERTKEELGGQALVHQGDLRDEKVAVNLVAAVLEWSGRLDGLVNNAGGQFPAPLSEISLGGWNAVVANNLTATFLVSRAAYLGWMRGRGGAIVNISADGGRGVPGLGHAAAARAGQMSLSATAAAEWARDGVRVNCVVPGLIGSSGLATYPEAWRGALTRIEGQIPLGRLGSEAEVAAAAIFLLTEAAAYITGAAIHVDGALRAYPRCAFLAPGEKRPPAGEREGS
jgi:citronellol/citronellal dehydrogenase